MRLATLTQPIITGVDGRADDVDDDTQWHTIACGVIGSIATSTLHKRPCPRFWVAATNCGVISCLTELDGGSNSYDVDLALCLILEDDRVIAVRPASCT